MAERLNVAKRFIDMNYRVTFVLNVCKLSRSTWYDHISEKRSKLTNDSFRGRPVPGYTVNKDGSTILDSTIIFLLKKYRERIEFVNACGYHKLKFYLRRDYGFFINGKKLYRLCKENGLLLARDKKKIKKSRKVCLNRIVTCPKQLWEFDIKYGYIHGENKFFYILSFLDVFSRKVVGYYVGRSCKAEHLRFTFKEALKNEQIKDDSGLVIRSDNGPQMTSNLFKDYISSINLEHEFIPPKACNKNAHIESFNSIIELDFLQVRYFRNFEDAYKQTMEFMKFYNEKRIHGSLKMHPPVEFIEKFEKGKIQIQTVSL